MEINFFLYIEKENGMLQKNVLWDGKERED